MRTASGGNGSPRMLGDVEEASRIGNSCPIPNLRGHSSFNIAYHPEEGYASSHVQILLDDMHKRASWHIIICLKINVRVYQKIHDSPSEQYLLPPALKRLRRAREILRIAICSRPCVVSSGEHAVVIMSAKTVFDTC